MRIQEITTVACLGAGTMGHGVAFLAAGRIVFSRGVVRGLTTGAGMWLAGAGGLARADRHDAPAAIRQPRGRLI